MKLVLSKTKLVLMVLVVLLTVILCAGCVQQGEDDELTIVVNFGPESENNFDPTQGWDGECTRELGIYEGLFYYNEKMELTPELATGYKQLSDTEWEIYIRKGVKFHDGTDLDADAVLFSMNRVLDKSNSRSSEYSFIKEIRKTGDYSIVIETTEPYAPTIASLTEQLMSIISPKIVNPSTSPVGTGPYVFVSASTGCKDVYLKKNSNYWGGDVGCEKIHVIINADGAARTFMTSSGESDITRDPLATEFKSLQSKGYNIVSEATLRTYFMYINEDKAPFDNVNVRKALSYALDRQEIVDTALEGVLGAPIVGVFTDTMSWNANDKMEAYEYNPEKALELLAAEGITKGKDGKLYYNGKPWEIEIQTYTSRNALPASLDVIAAQYEKLGIKVIIKYTDPSAIEANIKDNTHEMILYSWVTAPTGDPDYFISSHFLSTGLYARDWLHYSNPQVDEWINEARVTFDPAARKELYDKIQIQIQDDAAIINVFSHVENYAVKNTVSGFKIFPNSRTMITKDIKMD